MQRAMQALPQIILRELTQLAYTPFTPKLKHV